jgi:hypothetical protein
MFSTWAAPVAMQAEFPARAAIVFAKNHADASIPLARSPPRPHLGSTALFSVGLSCLAYATSSRFGAPK